MTQPYFDYAERYFDAGWPGVIPIPAGQKKPAPAGYTGWTGEYPSWPDIQTWIDSRPASNIALRLPGNVIGLDVDNYDGKAGAATLAAAQARWGTLPATWRSTSRDDGISGIRLFTVPTGLDWPGEVPGGGIETVHSGHRYVVASPSVHPNGNVYRWIHENYGDTGQALFVPQLDAIPALPIEWLLGLARGQHVDEPAADVDTREWLLTHNAGTMCQVMAKATKAALAGMGGSRHEHLIKHLLIVVRHAEAGHTGLQEALVQIRGAFLASVAADKSRTEHEATAECERALSGAVAKVEGSPSLAVAGDPCENQLLPPKASPATKTLDELAERVAEFADVRAATVGTEWTDPYGSADPFGDDAPAATVVADTADHSSWWPVDVGPALRGEREGQAPTMLARADGQRLMYPGKVNGFIGPSESGKTWLALELCRQALADNRRVLYLDFEDDVFAVVGHMLDLGAAPDAIAARFVYINPSEGLGGDALPEFNQQLAKIGPDDAIVLDGYNAAMTLLGLNLMDNKDATEFYQRVLLLLVKTGATIVYVDHTTKNPGDSPTAGAIGAQAKRAMTTGCAIKVEVTTTFGRGQTGKLKLTIDKDKPGFVRGASPGGAKLGTATLESDPITYAMTITIDAAESSADADGNFRPTGLMRKVTDLMVTMPGAGLTQTQIVKAVSGNEKAIKTAIDKLIEEGYVRREPVGQSFKHHLERPFVIIEDDTGS